MRKLCTLSSLLAFASVLAYAETWTGPLLDATCVQEHKADQKYEACTPAVTTTAFAIQTSGKMLGLDVDGNLKAAEVWKQYMSSADRAKDPNAAANPVATIEGSMNGGDEIKVDNIKLQ